MTYVQRLYAKWALYGVLVAAVGWAFGIYNAISRWHDEHSRVCYAVVEERDEKGGPLLNSYIDENGLVIIRDSLKTVKMLAPTNKLLVHPMCEP